MTLFGRLWQLGGRLLPPDSRAGGMARGAILRYAPWLDPRAAAAARAAAALAAHRTAPADVSTDSVPVRPGSVALDHFLHDPLHALTFPDAPSPSVSVIVLAADQADCLFRCLESLLAHGGDSYELLVMDGSRGDRTRELLSRLDNAAVCPDAPAAASRACNESAARASGRYLLFLDACAALAAGSMAALVQAIEAGDACAAVGGKLVRADGRLQEAGRIIWRDGTIEPYGRGADGRAPAFAFPREVDACSSAFLLVRRDLFDHVGGFDEGFGGSRPYAEADLAMAMRHLGHRVLYEPRAVCFLHGHPTGDGSGEDGAPAQERFVDKWRLDLDVQHDAARTTVAVARDRAQQPRVLVVDDRVPAASRGAGFPRSYALVEMLASLGYAVTMFPYRDPTPHQPYVHDLQRAGVEVMAGASDFAAFATERASAFDAVIVSRPPNFRDARALVRRHFPGAAVVYDAEALFYVREKLRAAVEGGVWLDAAAERAEIALLGEADVVMTVSEHERAIMTAAAPELDGRIRMWGHPVAPRPTGTPFASRRDLLFVGGFQASPSPNEDAVAHFVHDVLPHVRARVDCRLQVVGYRSAETLAGLASEAVRLTGYQEDLTGSYEACRVFVVPHRYSAGIPLKLCEAMARGLPAVVSELSARQLGVEHGHEVLVGRTPAEFAERVVELYTDEGLWSRLRSNGLAFVQRRHDPQTLRRELGALVGDAIAAARGRALSAPTARLSSAHGAGRSAHSASRGPNGVS